MHKRGIKHWVVPGAVLAATLVKAGIGLGSYSGALLRLSGGWVCSYGWLG